MLYLIKDITDSYIKLLCEDPDRPHIPHSNRIGKNKDVFLIKDDTGKVMAITCVSYQDIIPEDEVQLFNVSNNPNTAIFYTIWSYQPGAGRKLIFDSVDYIKENNPDIKRFVTLSPKTIMARNFHLKNGALIYRENQETINYEYINSQGI